jgi:hypothetical protein
MTRPSPKFCSVFSCMFVWLIEQGFDRSVNEDFLRENVVLIQMKKQMIIQSSNQECQGKLREIVGTWPYPHTLNKAGKATV